MPNRVNQTSRRGLAVPEWFAVVGGVAIVIFLGITFLGDATNTQLNTTSSTFLSPAEVTTRYKGNNGFGNGGGDGSPNGFQDSTR